MWWVLFAGSVECMDEEEGGRGMSKVVPVMARWWAGREVEGGGRRQWAR